MKKIILLIVLVTGLYFLTFSQINSQPEIENKAKSYSFDYFQKSLIYGDSIEFNSYFKYPMKNKIIPIPKFPDNNYSFGSNANGIIKSPQPIDNMPYLKPKGYFPMKIYQPDSTLKYTLLIKQH